MTLGANILGADFGRVAGVAALASQPGSWMSTVQSIDAFAVAMLMLQGNGA
jgi:hypothetical protein